MTPQNDWRKQLLVVDDDAACREALVEFFRREGFSVRFAADGNEAFELFRAGRVDFSVMDVHMPGMSGLEVLQRLSTECGVHRVPPTILMSSDPTAGALTRTLFGLKVDFVPKPVRLDALRRSIRLLLRTDP